MIFDKTFIRFRKDLLYKSLFYIINMIISGLILADDFYYISFFGGKTSDMVFDKTPNRIYKDTRSDYIEL